MRIRFRQKSPQRRLGFTLIEVLVVIGIVVLLIGLLLPAVNSARNSGYKAVDQSNLRQLALAVVQYHDANGYLPHSIRNSDTNNPRQSWVTQVLPFLERNDIASRYNYNVGWQTAGNRDAISTPINVLINPASPTPGRLDEAPENWGTGSGIAAITDYAAITGVGKGLVSAGLVDAGGNGILAKNVKSRFSDVTDGLSNTILLADAAGRPNYWLRGKKIGDPSTSSTKFDQGGSSAGGSFVNGGGWARNASDITLEGLILNQSYGSASGGTAIAGGGTNVSKSTQLSTSTPALTLITSSSDLSSATAATSTGGTVNLAYDPATQATQLWVINVASGVDVRTQGNFDATNGFSYYGTGGTGAIYSFLPGGANVAFGDGSVKFINEKTDVRVLARLVTRDQNDVVDLSSF